MADALEGKAAPSAGRDGVDGGGERLWTRGFVFLMLVQTADLFVYNMVTPVVAKYALSLGAEFAFAGMVASAFAFAAAFSRPISAMLADSLQRKRLVLVSIVMSCASLLVCAFVADFTALLVARVVHGFFYALFGTSIAAAAVATIPASRRSEGMGWFSTAYTFANAIGPALGVYISGRWGYQPMFVAGAAIVAASLVLACAIKIPSSSPSAGKGSRRPRLSWGSLVSRKCIPLAVVICALSTVWGFIVTFIVLAGESRGVVGAAGFFVANSFALLITRPGAGKICDSRGIASVFYPCMVFDCAAILLIAFSGQLWLFLLAGVVKAIGGGVWPSIQAACADRETEGRSGVAMATYLLGTDIGSTIGPMLGGVICGASGYTVMYLCCLPVIAIATAVFTAWWSCQRRAGEC